VAPQPAAITVKANIIETSTRDISLLLFHLFQTLVWAAHPAKVAFA
jgi:hypothetical protein